MSQHKVDTSVIDRMKQIIADLGLDVAKAAKSKQYHDQCAYKVAQQFNAEVDWSYKIYHAHVAMGRLESPYRPVKDKGVKSKVSRSAPRKSIKVVIGKKVPHGIEMRITYLSGMTRERVWKTGRRRHELAIADFLISTTLARYQAKAPVMIVIGKKRRVS